MINTDRSDAVAALTPQWLAAIYARLNDGLKALVLHLDDLRIQRHLKRVERRLRRRAVNSLPVPLRIARAQNLDRLRTYWQQREFPRHVGRPRRSRWRAPCFIDPKRRLCAVAHLVVDSGYSEVANRIASEANYALIEEMTFPELEAWAACSGLSQAELALIQPQYVCPEACAETARILLSAQIASNQWWITIGGVLGTIASVIGIAGFFRNWWWMLLIGTVTAIVAGAGLIYLAGSAFTAFGEVAIAGYIPCPGAGVVDACSLSTVSDLNLNAISTEFGEQMFTSGSLGFTFLIISQIGLAKIIGKLSMIKSKARYPG